MKTKKKEKYHTKPSPLLVVFVFVVIIMITLIFHNIYQYVGNVLIKHATVSGDLVTKYS